MRGLLVAVVVFLFGSFFTLVLERWMSEAPEWLWRFAYGVITIGAVAIALLSDPFYGCLKDYKHHAVASTALITFAGGVFLGSIWLFLIVGFPSAEAYRSAPAKSSSKKQPFLIDYDPANCGFFTLFSPSAKENGRKGIFLSEFAIVNNTGGSTTLKAVRLACEYEAKKIEVSATILPVGKLKDGSSGLMLQSGAMNVMLMNWNDIRRVILENKERVVGAIWKGSATFIIDVNVKSFDKIADPHLVVRDYLNRESRLPISPGVSNRNFMIRDQAFIQDSDGSFSWP